MLRRIMLAVTALLSSGAAEAEWYRASSKHFVVYADDTQSNVKEFTERLERFDKALRIWHMSAEDVRGPSARVTVYVVSNVGAVEKLAGSSDIAGFYNPRAGGSVAFTPRNTSGDLSARAILFHEYTHHWMLTNWTDAAMPPWFVEGFAELHATALFQKDRLVFGAIPLYRRYTVGQMNLLPMDRLLKFDPGRLSPQERDALYSHGWALTHYLTFDPERRKLLANYIIALNTGKPAGPSVLTGGAGNLDLKVNAYIRRPSIPSASFTFAELPIGAVEVEPLTPAEAAIMPAVLLSQRGVGPKNALQATMLARRLAAPFPNNAAAQNELAEAEYDLCSSTIDAKPECFSTAEAAADRALAADPKSIHALIYKGWSQTAFLKRAKIDDPARWSSARRWFLAANRIDTESPEPLIAFYDSFTAAKEAPSANAQAALLYAYALAPYDGALRMRAAAVYLGQDKPAEARIAIAPVAYNFDDGKLAGRAQTILKAIDSGDTKAALTELNKQNDSKDNDPDG